MTADTTTTKAPASTTDTTVVPQKSISPEKAAETREERQARFASVLKRGRMAEKLKVPPLAPGKVGQWAKDEPKAIERKQDLGFEVVKDTGQTVTDAGDGTHRVQDLILMQADKEVVDDIRAAKQELVQAHERKAIDDYIEKLGSLGEGMKPVNAGRVYYGNRPDGRRASPRNRPKSGG